MLILRCAPRAIPLFAVSLSIGLLVCLANTKAGEFEAPPYETLEYNVASTAPFENLRPAPYYRMSEPFGLEITAPVTGGLQNNWSAVTEKLTREHEILLQCRTDIVACPPAATKFLSIVDKALTQNGLARIGEINRTINLTIRWVNDMTQYGVPDLWATPLMTFASGAGDCEDYAIAKYVALREIGISPDNLRLVVVRNRTMSQQHAVAAVRYDGRWLILDNRTLVMARDLDVAAYTPLFVVDSEGVKYVTPLANTAQKPAVNPSPAAVGLQFSSGWKSTFSYL
jgi:predicted transglutaminase-like cysteine proteinase